MASVKLNIITGRTGDAHVASEDDAAIWRGLVGGENVVLFTDSKLALTNNDKQDGVGKLTIAGGVFCVHGGHMGRIGNPQQITFDLPAEGSYRRTLVVLRYQIQNNLESMWLYTLQNASANDAASAANAANLSVSTVPSTDYVLYDFVCNSNGMIISTLQTKLTVIDTIPILRAALDAEVSTRAAADTALGNRVSTLETYKNTETAERQSADTALGNRVSTLETWKNAENSTSYKLVQVNAPTSIGYGGVDYVVCRSGTTAYKTMWRDDTAINEYDLYYYKLTVNSAGTSASVQFYKLGMSAKISSTSGGYATILGTVKVVSA